MIKKTSDILPDFEYFVKGDNPKLLIHSGTHGDEYGIINLLEKAVIKYEDRLPDFIFVPIVSPSAVKAKTRTNNNGKDLNRIFFSDSNDLEVKTNIAILENNKFNLFVSFHEDFEFMNYYVYDEGFIHLNTDKVINHNNKLKNFGIDLFDGIDDPILKTEIVNGYKKFTPSKTFENDGMITSWLLSQKKVDDTLTPEIPMELNLYYKEKIINTFFEDILCIN